MESVTEILVRLRQQGYSEDFETSYHSTDEYWKNTKFKIDKTYRVDELSDPEEQAIVYAISSEDGFRRGTIVNAYGIYSDPRTNQLLATLCHSS